VHGVAVDDVRRRVARALGSRGAVECDLDPVLAAAVGVDAAQGGLRERARQARAVAPEMPLPLSAVL